MTFYVSGVLPPPNRTLEPVCTTAKAGDGSIQLTMRKHGET